MDNMWQHSNKGFANFDLTTLIKKEIYSRLGKKIAVANYCNSYIFYSLIVTESSPSISDSFTDINSFFDVGTFFPT